MCGREHKPVFAPADAAYMVPEKSTFCNGVCRIGGEAEAARFDFVTRNYRDASCLSLIDHHCFFFLSLSLYLSIFEKLPQSLADRHLACDIEITLSTGQN